MSIAIEEPFSSYAVYELRHAVNRVRDMLAAVDGEAQEAWSVADKCDDGAGGVLRGFEIEVVDAAEALSGEIFRLREALPQISALLVRLVTDGYKEVVPKD